MNDRFSKENISKLVKYTKYSNRGELFKSFVGINFDILSLSLILFWTFLYIIFNFNSLFFSIIFIPLFIFNLYYFYVLFIKYYLIKINKFQFKIKDIKTPVKFVFISDLHIGDDYYGGNSIKTKKIVKVINKLKPQLVVFGGDYVSHDHYNMKLLSKLKDVTAEYKIGVYGNHDTGYLKEEQQTKAPIVGIEKIKNLAIHLLNNEGILLELDGQKIFFGGITDLWSLNFDIVKAFEDAPKNIPRILISHNPDIIDFVEDKDDIDLILSGHTHAGQILLPFFGPIYPMPTKYKWLTRGVFNIGKKTKLLLSQGCGYSKSRLRIGTDNEICLVELLPDK